MFIGEDSRPPQVSQRTEIKGPAQGPGVQERPSWAPSFRQCCPPDHGGPTLANINASERAQHFPAAASFREIAGFVSSTANMIFLYLERLILKCSPKSKGKGGHGQASRGRGVVPLELGNGRGAGQKDGVWGL